MHHTATEYLYPSRLLTNIASFGAADETSYIHPYARLCESEIRRPESHLHILPIHLLHEEIKCLLQICEGDILIDIQSFNLVKEAMAPRTHSFIPIYPSRIDAPDRQLSFLHFSYLHIARMCAKKPVRVLLHIKRILHIAGRMMLVQVQRCEVVPIVFDLRSLSHRKSQSLEYRDNAIPHQCDGMPASQRNGITRQAQVDRRSGRTSLLIIRLDGFILCLHEVLELIHHLSELTFLIRWNILHLRH